MKVIDNAVQTKGFLTVLLLRFALVIPFNGFNYLMGATGVTLKDYFSGSALGMIPGVVAYVLIGAFIGSTTRDHIGSHTHSQIDNCQKSNPVIQIVLIVVGIIAMIMAIVLISVVAKKQLVNILEQPGKVESISDTHSHSRSKSSLEENYDLTTDSLLRAGLQLT